MASNLTHDGSGENAHNHEEFMTKKPATNAMDQFPGTHHQPGYVADGPAEFHAQVVPAGTADPAHTFEPGQSEPIVPETGDSSASQSAGKPDQGQSSAEKPDSSKA